MPTIAANLFAARESEGVKDNRNFDGWYHVDDHRYILWKKYSQLSAAIKAEVLPPYVILDFEHGKKFTLEDKLAPVIDFLAKSSHKYQPFIVKPENSQSHYVGGFLRKNADGKISIVFFNPVGRAELRIDYGNLRTDKNIEIISSDKKVQTIEKDNKRLSSCGPLSLAFVDYAMSNPEYMRTLDKQFNLPPSLNIENYDNEKYKDFVEALRKDHYKVLDTLNDKEDLLEAGRYDAQVTEAFFKYSEEKGNAKRDAELAAAANADGQEYAGSWDEAGADAGDSWGDEDNDDVQVEPDSVESDPEVEYEARAAIVRPAVVVKSDALIKPAAMDIQAREPSPAIVNKPVPPSPKAIDPEQREDVKFIRSQINRFRENAKSIFSINNVQKADAVERALNAAIASKAPDVRLDAGVKDALAIHRIFGFFGYKSTKATELNEESLTTKPIK